jgi:hypothetical protein
MNNPIRMGQNPAKPTIFLNISYLDRGCAYFGVQMISNMRPQGYSGFHPGLLQATLQSWNTKSSFGLVFLYGTH